MIQIPHTLYSFRRCPYAMRARMALYVAEISFKTIEVDFKNKPPEMLALSPKGSVPVLHLNDGTVIDESLDIMRWALIQNEPAEWRRDDTARTNSLITINDGTFKKSLDRYKYPNRYPDEDCSKARHDGEAFLMQLNELLSQQSFLCGDQVTLCDIAIFPFIRQFAHVEKTWFGQLPMKPLQQWLRAHLESDLFIQIMKRNGAL